MEELGSRLLCLVKLNLTNWNSPPMSRYRYTINWLLIHTVAIRFTQNNSRGLLKGTFFTKWKDLLMQLTQQILFHPLSSSNTYKISPVRTLCTKIDKFSICTFFSTFKDHRDTHEAGGEKLVKRSSHFSWLNMLFCAGKKHQNQNKTMKRCKISKTWNVVSQRAFATFEKRV